MGVIYLRTNLVNGMQYVGQSTNFKQREYEWDGCWYTKAEYEKMLAEKDC